MQRRNPPFSMAGVLVVLIIFSSPRLVSAAPSRQTTEWEWPLGSDNYSFIIRYNTKYETTVENTDYSFRNLDLRLGWPDWVTCFNVGAHRIYHAGIDLYPVVPPDVLPETADVSAIADGQVLARENGFPGYAILIQHTLPGPEYLYSVYMHLAFPTVEAGDTVSAGEKLGELIYNQHEGNFPEFHPGGDDTHLHFEIRRFYDATGFLPDACDAVGLFGVGYTYPNLPDKPPVGYEEYEYLDPVDFLQEHQSVTDRTYLPLMSKSRQSTPTCQEGQSLVQNGGFENGDLNDPPPWLEVSTLGAWSSPLVQNDMVFAGARSARLGSWDSEYIVDDELTQSFVIPMGTVNANWVFQAMLAPYDPVSPDPDDFFTLALNDAATGLRLSSEVRIDASWFDPSDPGWHQLEIPVLGLELLNGKNVSLSYAGWNDGLDGLWLAIDEVQFITYCGDGQYSDRNVLHLLEVPPPP